MGWPELVYTVRAMWLSVPRRQRRNAVIAKAATGSQRAMDTALDALPQLALGAGARMHALLPPFPEVTTA